MITQNLLTEYNGWKSKGFKPEIIYNATTDETFVSIIPLSWSNSLMLKKLK